MGGYTSTAVRDVRVVQATSETGGAGPAKKYLPTLTWILILGGLVRLALWLGFEGTVLHIWDERDYNALAVNLLRYHQFAFVPGTPISLRPPLYPVVVSATYGLFGSENFEATRLLQAGLSLLGILLLYRLGSEVYSRRVGVLLAGLFGFYPSLLGYNNLLLTEVQFTVLLCAALYSLSRGISRGSYAMLGLGGLLLALAALTRSVLWLFPPILGIFLLLSWTGSLRRRLLAVGALASIFCLVLSPWTIRNSRLEKTFQAVDCMGGRNFMMGNYEYTPLFRAWDAISIDGDRSWDRVLASSSPLSLRVTQGQKDKLALRQGLRFVRAHPRLTAKRDLIKFFNFWGLERELIAGTARGYFGALSLPALLLLTLIIFGSYTVAMVTGIFGALMTPPADWRIHWLLLLTIGFICGMHTLSFGHSRYHLPVMPLVLLYSAAAIDRRRVIWSRRREWRFRLACVLSVLLIMGWIQEIVFIDLERYLRALKLVA